MNEARVVTGELGFKSPRPHFFYENKNRVMQTTDKVRRISFQVEKRLYRMPMRPAQKRIGKQRTKETTTEKSEENKQKWQRIRVTRKKFPNVTTLKY